MNRLNYAQRSNFIAGTSEVFKYEFYIQEFNLPSLTINSIESFSQGMKHILTGDSVTHSELDLTVMIDEDFLVYQAFKDWMEKSVDQKSGSFANREFTFYCDVHNSKGNYLFTVMFYGCKIQTMSDVQLSTTDDTFTNTMTISVDYDWFEFKRSGLPDEWKKDFKIITINDETESEVNVIVRMMMKEIYDLYGENSDAVLDELRTRKEESEINYNYFYRSFGDFDLEEYVDEELQYLIDTGFFDEL